MGRIRIKFSNLKKKIIKNKIIFTGSFFCISYLILDYLICYYTHEHQHNFIQHFITFNLTDIWIHMMVLILILLLSIYAQIKFNTQMKLERKLIKIEYQSKRVRDELEDLFDTIPAVVFYKDVNDVNIWVNKYLANSLNLTKEEIIGRKTSELFPTEQSQSYRKDDLEIINSRKPKLNIEESWDTPNGTRYALTYKIPRFNENREVIGLIGFVFDTTQLKSTEIRLKKSEERYRFITENIHDLISILDSNAQYEYVNEKPHFNLLGYTKTELFEKGGKVFMHPVDFTQGNQLFNNTANNGEFTLETRLMKRDGNYIWVESKGKKFTDTDGNDKTLMISRDINRRKLIELELIESEERYYSLFKNSPFMIILLDQQGKIFDINLGTFRKYGFRKDDFLNKNIKDIKFLSQDNLQFLIKKLPTIFKNGFIDPLEILVYDKKGAEIWVKMQGILITLKSGKLIQAIVQDIDEQKKAEENLYENEKFLSNIFSSIQDGICIIDKNYTIIHTNSRMEDWYPHMIPVEGKKCFQVYQHRTEPCEDCLCKELFETRKPMLKTIYRKGIKGRNLGVLEIYTFPLLDQKTNKIKGVIEYLRDVTERNTALEKLKVSEEKYRLITENANDLIVILDGNFKYEYINEKVHKKLIGYTKEEIIGKRATFLVHPDDIEMAAKTLRKGFVRGEGEGEVRIRHKNGNYKWLGIKGKAIKDKDGIKKALLISRDVTKRKNAAIKLKESEEKYRLITENAFDLIIVLNTNFRIEFVNEIPLSVMLGYTPNELLGELGIKLVHPYDRKEVRKSLAEILEKDKVSTICRIKKRDGSYRWFETKAKMFKDSNNLTKFILTGRDITEQKKAEELIEKELIKLKELDEIKTEFVNRASHEIKTPLTSIYSASSLLLDLYENRFDKKVKNLLYVIKNGGKRLNDLSDNLFDVSRIESSEFKLELENVNLVEIIQNVVNKVTYLAEERNIKLNVNVEEEFLLKADKIRIGSVLNEILTNAIKNTPSKGNISIDSKINFESVQIIITDTGVGFTLKEKQLIFKKFGKIERYGKGLDVITEGSGLGLYLAKEIINLHRGKIQLKSEGRNKGTTCIIELPVNIGS